MIEMKDSKSELAKTSSGELKTVTLNSPGVGKIVARKLLKDINQYAINTYFDKHRWHLGASEIGHECSRYLWYKFRWCGIESGIGKTDEEKLENLGRSVRLWNRGHREEQRFKEFLEGIGCQLWTHDEKGNQFRMSAVNGHYGGSMDGVLKLPIEYNVEEPLLAEFKTNGTGQGFNELLDNGVAVSKSQHFIQASCYGKEWKLKYAAYFNVNKNDDNLHIEVIELNWNLAEQFKAKAERIILSQEPLPKLSLDPKFWKCAYCSMKSICHDNKPILKNCRSCLHSRPAENAEWFCTSHNSIIPREFVPTGCNQYKAIVNE